MGLIRNIFMCLAIFAIATSCEKRGDPVLHVDTVPLSFVSPSIVESKAAVIPEEGNFPFSHDAYPIGLWLMQKDSKTVPQIEGFDNLKSEYLIADGMNNWKYYPFGTDQDSETTLHVLQKRPIDIYAYYPWVSDATDITAISFDSGQDDWMIAAPVKMDAEDTESEVHVRLDFQHIMTCIEVGITCLYEGSISLTSMTLTDSKGRLVASGTFDCTTGQITGASGSSITISPNMALRGGYRIPVYIIMPSVSGLDLSAGEMTLSFMFNGIDAETKFILPAKMNGSTESVTEFKKGYRYIYNLTLDNTMDFIPVGVEKLWTTEEIVLPI